MVFGGLLGGIASFMQLLEKLNLLKNPNVDLICNVNSVLNCTSVLNAWQSSVFGFPNSIMSLTLFIVFFTIGLVGSTGGVISRKLRLVIQFLSLFTLCFGTWFLWQSTFSIGAICLYCILNFAGLVLINLAWVRINYQDAFGSKSLTDKLNMVVSNNLDLAGWGLLSLMVLITIYLRLGLY